MTLKDMSIFELSWIMHRERWPISKQYEALQALLEYENPPPRTYRRNELEAGLRSLVMRDLRAGSKGARKAS